MILAFLILWAFGWLLAATFEIGKCELIVEIFAGLVFACLAMLVWWITRG